MTFLRLLLLNLAFHRRGNFAVFLGVALGTAVLTGALLVGDSLQGSLKELALDQLGWVENAMTANRFFREELARNIDVAWSCPALLLRGSADRRIPHAERHGYTVNKVTVLGIDERFWPKGNVPISEDFWRSSKAEVVLNQTLAEALKVGEGDKISLHVQKADNVPREFLLGKRRKEDVVEAVEVTVHAVLPDHGMARFTLQPSPEPVRNAFVPLRFLQQKLNLADRANALLTAGPDSTPDVAGKLELADWGLKLLGPMDRARNLVHLLDPRNKEDNIRPITGGGGWLGRVPDELENPDKKAVLTLAKVEEFYRQHRNYALLESEQMLLENAVVEAVKKALPGNDTSKIFKIGGQDWWLCPMLIYLADSIAVDKNDIAYAVVAARGPQDVNDVPPGQRQIDLAEYPGPVTVKPGDAVTLSYYAPDDHNHLQKLHEKFTVRKTFPLKGRYDDADLVPQFPGITDKLDLKDWDPESLPFPYDPVRGGKGEAYWKRYRGTPRAYINLETAQKLWGSRFGKLTSFQFMPVGGKTAWKFESDLLVIRDRILKALDPAKGGFVWQNVREQGKKAGQGSTDFGQYFFYFSFFLIVAALLLVGLLFRLNLDLRGRELGILLATGWTMPQVRRVLLCEGGLLAIFGALAGLGGSLLYADQLLKYLSRNWPGEQKLQFLRLHVTPFSLAIGWSASVVVSFLTILWAVRVLSRMTPTRLLAGETTASAVDLASGGGKPRRDWSKFLVPTCAFGAGGLLVGGMFAKGQEAQAISFFMGGMLVLVLGLVLMWRQLRPAWRVSDRNAPHSAANSLIGLAVRNAGRHAVRSVLTIGLLASATFLIVAVESFHKEAGAEFLQKTGGSGGFPLYAQADIPIFQDLNDKTVRAQLKVSGEVTFYPCRLQAGDDASCLNLYQPQMKPRILGVPRTLIDRGGFAFDQTEVQRQNPWELLTEPAAQADEIPVFVDSNSAGYILHKSIGKTYQVTNDQGENVKLRIVGLLHESVFQSEIVMSDANFRRLFPRQEGFSFFLIDGPADEAGTIKTEWERALSDNGVSIETTTSRLDKFLAVENMYLATFQALGALGLLLGAAGLAIVLLRSVWERRAELALMRALGFRRFALAWLVMAENAFLLLAGLVVGIVAAVLAVAPHLVGGEAHLLGLHVLKLLALVVAVGLAAGLAAVFTTLRAPLLHALRNE